MDRFAFGKTTIAIIQGDITVQDTEAIVNPANSSLMGGGGVDGAIHRIGGEGILQECMKIRATRYRDGLPSGEAIITSAGNLPAKRVIHVVGPIWRGGNQGEEKVLMRTYQNCLEIARAADLKSIAFPSISTGAFGYPIEKAGRVALRSTRDFLREKKAQFQEIRFVLFTPSDHDLYLRFAAEEFPL